jgi:hypothetical protein
MRTKTQQLLDLMDAGDWRRALALAATFRMLGPHRATIVRGHEAGWHPEFFRAIGHDPEQAVAAGIAALQDLYPRTQNDQNGQLVDPTSGRSPAHRH